MQPLAMSCGRFAGGTAPAWQVRHTAIFGIKTSLAACDLAAAWQVAQLVSEVPWRA